MPVVLYYPDATKPTIQDEDQGENQSQAGRISRKRRRQSQQFSRRPTLSSSSSMLTQCLLPVMLLLLLVILLLPTTYAEINIGNANLAAEPSTVGAYEYQAVLKNKTSPDYEVLIFRWSTPDASSGVLKGILEHTVKSEAAKPRWISFGFLDQERITVPIQNDRLRQVMGQAIVGSFFYGQREVFMYNLGSPHGQDTSTNSSGGVSLLKDTEQTLLDQSLEQGTSQLLDGTSGFKTILGFTKTLDEGTNDEAVIHLDQDNVFLWALGPTDSAINNLGMHEQAGAFWLNFGGESGSSSGGNTGGSGGGNSGSGGGGNSGSERTIFNATANFQPVTVGPNDNYDHQVSLYEGLTMYWQDPGKEGVFKARLEHKADTMVSAPSWISFGFYDVIRNPRPVTPQNFDLSGSTAIIGMPWGGEDDPKMYKLGLNHNVASVQPIQSQHLMDSYYLQYDDRQGEGEVVYTTLSFEMNMKDPTPDEPSVIAAGDDIFLWAMGPPGASSLGMHSEYGALHLDLAAVKKASSAGTNNNANIALINHVDGTQKVVLSSDSEYDYQVQVQEDLIFTWKKIDPQAQPPTFFGRLQHTTKFWEDAPAWLGFGFPDPTDSSTWLLKKNTFAIIGQLPSEKVQKYSLGANNNHTNGFVQPLPQQFQTLQASQMIQHKNPETGILTTELTFNKLLVETANPLETPIREAQENTFLWAVGNALTGTPSNSMGMHRDFGGLKLDFAKVEEKDSNGLVPAAPVVDDSTTDSAGGDEVLSPEIEGKCSSSVFENSGKSIQLTPDLTMHWVLNDVQGSGLAEFGEDPSVTILLEYEGLAWLGFGFSNSGRAHSMGSSAVIGIPATASEPQLKYNISSDQTAKIIPLNDQTLIESSVKQGSSRTTLRFTKALQDGKGEVAIKSKGMNYFSFAIGSGNTLDFHRHRGSFQLDLSECYDGLPYFGPTEIEAKGKGALTAHAVLAGIAWGFAMPCAVGMAWFRQLIPTTWIYVHVSFNLLAFVLTLFAVLIGVGAVSSRETSRHFTKGHHWIGLLLFVGYTFQVANGFLRPPVTRKADGTPIERKLFSLQPPESARELWHLVHRSMGIIMLFFGIVQIATGMNLYDENFGSGRDNFFWYWTYLSIFALLMFFVKVYLVMKGLQKSGSGNWIEDRAATSAAIENFMMSSDPDGMDIDSGNVVLEIPSRSGEPTVIRGARRINSPSGASSDHSSTSDLDDDIDEIHLDDTENGEDEDYEQVTRPKIT